ncbi:uncharacterized protein AAGF69_013029 [Amazona ochrocephala]
MVEHPLCKEMHPNSSFWWGCGPAQGRAGASAEASEPLGRWGQPRCGHRQRAARVPEPPELPQPGLRPAAGPGPAQEGRGGHGQAEEEGPRLKSFPGRTEIGSCGSEAGAKRAGRPIFFPDCCVIKSWQAKALAVGFSVQSWDVKAQQNLIEKWGLQRTQEVRAQVQVRSGHHVLRGGSHSRGDARVHLPVHHLPKQGRLLSCLLNLGLKTNLKSISHILEVVLTALQQPWELHHVVPDTTA